MPALGERRWKWQGVMQLRMPRGQVVSPRRRGYAGNCAARQAFFSYFFERFLGQNLSCRGQESLSLCVSLCLSPACHPGQLIVGKIIRPKLRRRSEHLIALDVNAAMPARSELILVRIRRNDSGAP